jgi:allophanate hydrolase subunit 1
LIQRTIEEVLQGIPSVQVMLDDMAITSKDDQEHLQNLDKVLARLEEYDYD